MPLLGKNRISMPAHRYVDAASVHDLPRQRDFQQQDYRLVDEPYGQRLQALQEPGATTRLNQLAERSKIVLSASSACRAELGFIEPGLSADIGEADFKAAITGFISQLQRTLAGVHEQLEKLPESVFLTGGTSRSPHVMACVREAFPGIPLVLGDPSLGVVSGLARAAREVPDPDGVEPATAPDPNRT